MKIDVVGRWRRLNGVLIASLVAVAVVPLSLGQVVTASVPPTTTETTAPPPTTQASEPTEAPTTTAPR